MASIDHWEDALRQDIRLNSELPRCWQVGFTRPARYQVSFEHLAGLAGFIELVTVRRAVGLLRQTGWIRCERVPGATNRGLEYRPLISTSTSTAGPSSAQQDGQPYLPSSSGNS